MSKAFKDSRMAIADIDRAMSISDITNLWSMLIGIVVVFIGLVMVWGMWRGGLTKVGNSPSYVVEHSTIPLHTNAIPQEYDYTPTDMTGAVVAKQSEVPL